MTERSPNIPTIQPFLAESANAQAVENKNAVGMPTQQPTPTDSNLTQLGSAAIGGAVAVTAIFKLFEKFGSNLIDGQKSRLSLDLRAKELELEAEKAERLAARKEEESKGELIKSTLNTALSNVYQTSRESREIYYLLAEKMQSGNDINQKAFVDIGDRLESQDRRLDLIEQTMKDILMVLRMSDRGNK